MTFAQALTKWKATKGWSDDQIAAATGLHRSTVRALRKGWNAPQPRTRKALASLPGFGSYLLDIERTD